MDKDKELIVFNKPKSNVAEAIKIIRTNIQFSSVDSKTKSILVTSSVPGEGKSFIASNLAVAFSQAGSKVLLVDCDMRRGRQHKVFNVSNEKGLSNLLIDDIENLISDYIIKTEINRISLLPCGTTPPNSSKLLSSKKMKKLVKILDDAYDIVIYDGVPMGGLVDSLIMAELVDKIVVVCAHKETPLNYIQSTMKTLENFKDKIAGVVLNKAENKDNSYYTKYYQ